MGGSALVGEKSDVATIRAAFASRVCEQSLQITSRLGSFQTTIAAAVQEQTATTEAIGRDISQSTTNSAEIAANIATISTSAQSTTSGVIDIQLATQELSRLSNGLRVLVGQFRV